MKKHIARDEGYEYIPAYNSDNHYITTHLDLSSALLTVGHDLTDIDKEDPNRAKFIFARNKNLDQAVEDYWPNELIVNARAFSDNQKMLKNRLYNE